MNRIQARIAVMKVLIAMVNNAIYNFLSRKKSRLVQKNINSLCDYTVDTKGGEKLMGKSVSWHTHVVWNNRYKDTFVFNDEHHAREFENFITSYLNEKGYYDVHVYSEPVIFKHKEVV